MCKKEMKKLEEMVVALKHENDELIALSNRWEEKIRAYFTAAEFHHIDELLQASLETYQQIGAVVQERTKEISKKLLELDKENIQLRQDLSDAHEDADAENGMKMMYLRNLRRSEVRILVLEEALVNIKEWCEGSTCEICGIKKMTDTDCYDYVRTALKDKKL